MRPFADQDLQLLQRLLMPLAGPIAAPPSSGSIGRQRRLPLRRPSIDGSCEQKSVTSSPWSRWSSRRRSWFRCRALPSCWLTSGRGAGPAGSGAASRSRRGRRRRRRSGAASRPGVDRDAAVAGGVAGERDHRDLGVEVGEETDALEAEPASPPGAVFDPDRARAPLLADVAGALQERGRPRRGQLGGEDVDLRVREVADAAGVVEVEMGGDDVADVGAGHGRAPRSAGWRSRAPRSAGATRARKGCPSRFGSSSRRGRSRCRPGRARRRPRSAGSGRRSSSSPAAPRGRRADALPSGTSFRS